MTTEEIHQVYGNAGLLFLRIAGGLAFALIFVLSPPAGQNLLLEYAWRAWLIGLLAVCSFLVASGIFTRSAAAVAAAVWIFAAYTDLRTRQAWYSLPVRNCEFVFLFAALALAGPGKFSLERRLRPKAAIPK